MKCNHLLAFFGHHKCGTRWILRILSQALSELSLNWVEFHNERMFGHNLAHALKGTRTDCLCYTNAKHQYVSEVATCRGFHVIRDPRDIVISAYYSHLYSHPTDNWPQLHEYRCKLKQMSKEDGLMWEMEFLRRQFGDMYSWDYSMPNVLEVKMERLIQDPYTSFIDIFRFLGLLSRDAEVETADKSCFSEERLLDIVYRNRFAVMSKGRTSGDEDVTSHYRKGVPGDWRNHFSLSHAQCFESHYGVLLKKLGYEQSSGWVSNFDVRSREDIDHRQCSLVGHFEAAKSRLDDANNSESVANQIIEDQRTALQKLTLLLAENAQAITLLRGQFEARSSCATTSGKDDYRPLVGRIQATLDTVAPITATVAVISKGDEELLRLNGRRAWHMPSEDDETYSGHHPANSDEAIDQLQRLLKKGAEYLLIPETSLWWLDHYTAFREHLDAHYQRIPTDPICAIYQLSPISHDQHSGESGRRVMVKGEAREAV